MLELRFYPDPETGEPHIYSHDVVEAEVEGVFENPGYEQAGRNGARIRTGQTDEGRYLQVVYTEDGSGSIFVITAYSPTPREIAAFRRRRRKGK